MKGLITTTVFIMSIYICKAQVDALPKYEKIVLISEEGIQYKFPENVEIALNNAIMVKENESQLLELETVNDSTFILVLYAFSKENNGVLSNNKIVNQTRRYYQYKKERIPIIFDTDYKFSTPGFTFTDDSYWLEFRFNARNDKGLILHCD